MAYEFKLPDLGEGLTEGEVARWLVAEGQEIAEDEPLVEIQTDKTTVEIPSPAAGVVARILVPEGDGRAGRDGARRDRRRRRGAGAAPRLEPAVSRVQGSGRVRATPARQADREGARRRPRLGQRDRPAGARITEEDVRRAGVSEGQALGHARRDAASLCAASGG